MSWTCSLPVYVFSASFSKQYRICYGTFEASDPFSTCSSNIFISSAFLSHIYDLRLRIVAARAVRPAAFCLLPFLTMSMPNLMQVPGDGEAERNKVRSATKLFRPVTMTIHGENTSNSVVPRILRMLSMCNETHTASHDDDSRTRTQNLLWFRGKYGGKYRSCRSTTNIFFPLCCMTIVSLWLESVRWLWFGRSSAAMVVV